MTREEYLKRRKENHFDLNQMYEFYKERVLDYISFNDFDIFMREYINRGGSINGYLRHYDVEFNVMILHTPEQTLFI